MVTATKLRPLQTDHIQPSRSSTIHRDVDPTRTQITDVPPNPVKRPEHPIFLESSYESALPSTARAEPTESLTSVAKTDQKKQQYPTVLRTDMVKTQEPHRSQSSATVNKTTSREQPIIVTRVDSSVTKVTSTVVPMPDNKTNSQTTDSTTTQLTKNATKTTTSAKAESNATVRMKPKEVSLSFQYYRSCS